jgi:hypothetical protein
MSLDRTGEPLNKSLQQTPMVPAETVRAGGNSAGDYLMRRGC